jgi:hypothetical protein
MVSRETNEYEDIEYYLSKLWKCSHDCPKEFVEVNPQS